MTTKGKTIPGAALTIATLISACSEEVTNQKIEEFRRTGNFDLTVGEMLSGVIPQEQAAPADKPQPVYRRTAAVATPAAKPQPNYLPPAQKIDTTKRSVTAVEEEETSDVEINLID